MRLTPLALVTLVAAAALAGGAAAQETEAPSSKPPPSPGAPAPPSAAPPEGRTPYPSRPDRDAARAAVRAQCGAERARYCRGAADDACLVANVSKLGSDCQSAVEALQQSHQERGGG